MSAKVGLVMFAFFCCSHAFAQDQSTNHPCADTKVTTAIAEYFEKPAALVKVASQNQLILAMVAPWPQTGENHRVTILGQRSLTGTDFSCLVDYTKTMNYKDIDMILNLHIKSTFDLLRYGSDFTVTEREQLDGSINATKGSGEPLNAMGLDRRQEQALIEKFKPASPEERANFLKHPSGTAEQNGAILRSPFPGQPAASSSQGTAPAASLPVGDNPALESRFYDPVNHRYECVTFKNKIEIARRIC